MELQFIEKNEGLIMKFKFTTLLKLFAVTACSFLIAFSCFYWSGESYKFNNAININNTIKSTVVSDANYETSVIPADFKDITTMTVEANVSDIIIKKDHYGKVELMDSAENVKSILVSNNDNYMSINYSLHGSNKMGGTLTVSVPSSVTNIVVKSISGDVNVPADLELQAFSVNTVSGDLTINNLVSKNANLHTTMGDINYTGTTANLTAQSVRGDLSIINSKKLDNIIYDLKTVSGDITLKLPKDTTAKISTRTVNGDTEITGVRQDQKSDSSINLDTVNGNIVVGVTRDNLLKKIGGY